MPKLTIDNQEIEVEPGTSILQAAEQLGVEIPRFCYHDKLSVPANCRMCLVELEGAPKPVASCAMAAGDGMVINTKSDTTQKARKGVMEMLLINHPLDCPICDQGGECDLQDQAMAYGFDRSRYAENKRAVPDKDLGPLVKTIMTRCINCTRCVRFGEEIAGVSDLGQFNRGEDAEIGTYVEKAVCTEMSGNLIDVCPVGALTSKPYAFTARPWELRKTETIDVHDAVGCNIRVDVRGSEVMRVLPRLHEDVNEEWIGDRSRFSVDGLKYARLDRPYMRDSKTGKMQEVSWEEALSEAAHRLSTYGGDKIAGVAGDLADAESMVALKDLLGAYGSKNVECLTGGEQYDTTQRAGYIFNSGIAGIDQADVILLVGTNPRWEATLVNARIFRNWSERRIPIGFIGPACDLTYPYEHLGQTPGDLQKLISAKSGFSKILREAKNPMVIVGSGAFAREDGQAFHAMLHEAAESFDLIKEKEGWNGFNMLQNAASRVAALELGYSSQGQGAGESLEDMALVYLLGADDSYILNAIHPEAYVIYQGHHGDAGAARADLILPGAAYTEKDGLYMNTEGRLQRGVKASNPPGQAKIDWTIIRALSETASHTLPYDNLYQLRQRMIEEFPAFGELDVLPEAQWHAFGEKGSVASTAFSYPLQDYYQTNVITRASPTMGECSQFFNKEDAVLAEAAE